MKDAFGFDIQQNDAVAWSCRRGSAMWLNKGIVEQVHDSWVTVKRMHPKPTKYVTLRTPSSVVLIGVNG